MALTFDQITSITERKFLPKLVDNVFNSNVLLKKLKATEKLQSGGTQILQPLIYDEVSASGWYQGAETLDTTDNELFTAAAFDWAQAYANISISRLDELKNSGDQAVLNFVKSKMMIAEKTLSKKLSTAVYNDGSSAKQIQGLRLMLSTSNTYGGISQSDYSFWAANIDSSTTTLTLASLQSVYGDCGEGTEYPNLMVCDQDLWDLYKALLSPQQRFASSDSADGGFRSLLFNSTPVFVDASAPSGHMIFLNMNYLDWMPHKDENMRIQPWASPINQNVKSSKIFWAGGMASSNNRRHGALTAITA